MSEFIVEAPAGSCALLAHGARVASGDGLDAWRDLLPFGQLVGRRVMQRLNQLQNELSSQPPEYTQRQRKTRPLLEALSAGLIL